VHLPLVDSSYIGAWRDESPGVPVPHGGGSRAHAALREHVSEAVGLEQVEPDLLMVGNDRVPEPINGPGCAGDDFAGRPVSSSTGLRQRFVSWRSGVF
jgi:hypothetical protein